MPGDSSDDDLPEVGQAGHGRINRTITGIMLGVFVVKTSPNIFILLDR